MPSEPVNQAPKSADQIGPFDSTMPVDELVASEALVTELYDIARELAVAAGELVREGRARAITDVGTKSNATDVVTAMDTACEQFLIEQIAVRRPGDAVFGEEKGTHAGTTGIRWLVDPIDGTVNYLYGIPDYAVSIAAEVAGTVVAGAVARPESGELFHARAGGGAFLGSQRLSGSAPESLAVTLVATGFNYDPVQRARQGQLVATMLTHVRDIRRIGSAALDLCYAAAGRLDATYEWGLHLWDYSAAALIAREAGLVVHLPADQEGLVLVAAPTIAADLLAALDQGIDTSWEIPA